MARDTPTEPDTMLVHVVAAVALIGQGGPKIEKSYEEFKNLTLLTAKLGVVHQVGLDRLEIDILYGNEGKTRGALPPETKVSLHFKARCKTWRYLKHHDITIIAGGDRYDLGEPNHDGAVESGYVTEQFFGRLTLGQLAKISEFPEIKFQVGIDEFALGREQARVLGEFADRLKRDEASVEKADRERNEKVVAEYAEAQREAKNSARRGSKSLMQRNYDREMLRKAKEICDKHNISITQLFQIVGEKEIRD